ncbi:MAG: serine/threonine-protein kinase RsbW [Solirubrobacteraceae bacterium]|nr:serine/threonine-protein kinase RsbW [Solirubrobacteraceae bacterium]
MPESTPQLRRAITRFAAAAGAAEGAVENISLAVSEAVTNVVVHAYADESGPGAVRITAALEGGWIHITVSDDGRGMVPRLDSPGLGLGLPLISQTADAFDVHHAESGGTELRMSFRLSR